MAQKAKRFLRNKVLKSPGGFTIQWDEGGYVGSLTGLGFVQRISDGGREQYSVTEKGREWCLVLK